MEQRDETETETESERKRAMLGKCKKNSTKKLKTTGKLNNEGEVKTQYIQ